jgi:hypothetical protein
MVKGVLLSGSVSTTTRARPGADHTSSSPCARSRRSASPQASRDSDHKAMWRRVTLTSGLPRCAASQARRTATWSAFERPAIWTTACSQSKRTGPVVVGGEVKVRKERSRSGGNMVGLPEGKTMACCRQGWLPAAPRRRCGKTGVRRESPGVPKRGEAQVQGEAVGGAVDRWGIADPESPGFPPRQTGGFPPRLARFPGSGDPTPGVGGGSPVLRLVRAAAGVVATPAAGRRGVPRKNPERTPERLRGRSGFLLPQGRSGRLVFLVTRRLPHSCSYGSACRTAAAMGVPAHLNVSNRLEIL